MAKTFNNIDPSDVTRAFPSEWLQNPEHPQRKSAKLWLGSEECAWLIATGKRKEPWPGRIDACYWLNELPSPLCINKETETDGQLVADDPDARIDYWEGVNFLTRQLNKGLTAYVHCHAGVSRSAAMVIALLMSMGMEYAAATEALRCCRPTIAPNIGFRRQLERINGYIFLYDTEENAMGAGMPDCF